MNPTNQIIIEIPYECLALFKEGYEISKDYLSPMKEDAIMKIMRDLNHGKIFTVWLYLLKYRTEGIYIYSPSKLKKLFGISENTARRIRIELESKGYLIPIGFNRFRFEPYPEKLRNQILEEPELPYKVYKLTFPNGKYYIEKTKQRPEDRWNNGEGYQGQRVYQAIVKYGWNNVKKEILASDLNDKEAAKIEHICIKLYNSMENGYNDIP